MVEKKTIPAHVVEQRAKRVNEGRSKRLRGRREQSELHDVFRRINMHNGNKEVCWEWSGAHGLGTRGEYRARVRVAQKDYYVHRIVYSLYTGYELQEKDVVRHMCDNSWCCNPYHMLIGTQADNVQDMLERERVGIKLFHIKRIMQMFEVGCTAEYICEKMKQGYNMQLDVSVIRKIRLRKVYKHVEWPWGDAYAHERRQRLREVRAAKLASDPECGIISNSQQGETSHDEEEG